MRREALRFLLVAKFKRQLSNRSTITLLSSTRQTIVRSSLLQSSRSKATSRRPKHHLRLILYNRYRTKFAAILGLSQQLTQGFAQPSSTPLSEVFPSILCPSSFPTC